MNDNDGTIYDPGRVDVAPLHIDDEPAPPRLTARAISAVRAVDARKVGLTLTLLGAGVIAGVVTGITAIGHPTAVRTAAGPAATVTVTGPPVDGVPTATQTVTSTVTAKAATVTSRVVAVRTRILRVAVVRRVLVAGPTRTVVAHAAPVVVHVTVTRTITRTVRR